MNINDIFKKKDPVSSFSGNMCRAVALEAVRKYADELHKAIDMISDLQELQNNAFEYNRDIMIRFVSRPIPQYNNMCLDILFLESTVEPISCRLIEEPREDK